MSKPQDESPAGEKEVRGEGGKAEAAAQSASQASAQGETRSGDSLPVRGGLLRSGLIVSVMTMLSRVLGLARDVTIASLLGAGSGADAFFVAFKIPNFMRRLFAEGAFNQAFIPVLSEYATRRTREEVRELLDAVSGSLGVILALITALAMLCAPWLVWVFAPGSVTMPASWR